MIYLNSQKAYSEITHAMKIFRASILLLFICFLQSNLLAQDFYLRVGAGYAFPMARGNFNVDHQANSNTFSDKFLGGSYGQGVRFDLTAIYYYNDKWSGEFGYEFNLSPRKLYNRQDLTDYFLETYTKAVTQYLKPAVAYHFDPILIKEKERLIPYAKMGLVIPVSVKVNAETSVRGEITDGNYAVDQKETFRHIFSVGFLTGIGANYSINDFITLFAEVEYRNLGTRVKRSYLTDYKSVRTTQDKTETRYLYNLSTSEKESLYHKEIDGNSNVNVNPEYNTTEPTDKLTFYQPLSNFAINVGVIFKLNLQKLLNPDYKEEKPKESL